MFVSCSRQQMKLPGSCILSWCYVSALLTALLRGWTGELGGHWGLTGWKGGFSRTRGAAKRWRRETRKGTQQQNKQENPRIASVVSGGDEEAPALGTLCRSLSLCLGAAAEQQRTVMNSSLEITVSLQILWNPRNLTSAPCIFKTINTYANDIQTIGGRGTARENWWLIRCWGIKGWD